MVVAKTKIRGQHVLPRRRFRLLRVGFSCATTDLKIWDVDVTTTANNTMKLIIFKKRNE
jgi:hypothetical protein